MPGKRVQGGKQARGRAGLCQALLSLLLFTLLLLCVPVRAEPVLTMGYVEFPPFFFTDARGQAQGTIIEMARKVTQRAGYQLNPVYFPPRRMEKSLAEGRIDLWIGLDTFELMAHNTLSSKTVVSTIELRAYHKPGKPPISHLDQLAGSQVGVYFGYSYGGWMKRIQDPASGIEPVFVRIRSQAARMLTSDRIDYLLDYRGPFESQVDSNITGYLEYETLATYNLYFVLSRKRPDTYQLMSQLENAWRQLKREGEI
ncbi:substrate-binding periplasmic protein [Aestuariirhabdus litorea]|nr:transporter substrate-binding domain-containing protein [Aestuariirhabdus litorea]